MEKLKRTLTLFDTTVAGIGIIIGAGIYAIIGHAAGIVGNAIWLSFLIGAIVAAMTALSYAELASMFPKAGAEYVYARKSFGNRMAFIVNWLLIIGTVFSVATVSLGFASYLKYFIEIPYSFAAVALIVVFTALNIYGIKESVTVANIGGIIEIIGLLIIILVGLPYLGNVDYFILPEGAHYSALFFGASLLFFAFLGFESIPRLSEETKNAEEVIPKATLLSLAISTIIYILVSLVAVSVIDWKILSSVDAPLAYVANKAMGGTAGLILALIALFATANTVLLMLITTTRLLYGLGEGGKIFEKLGSVSKRKTPWVAALVLGILSIVAVMSEDISFVAYSADFATFFTFGTINLAVIWFRYTQPEIRRGFKVPDIFGVPIIPMVGAASCLLLATTSGTKVIIIGSLLAFIGLLLYEVLKKMNLAD
ncbi:MAG: APC family permease [Candidatus Micrarchaeota archaeon]|nr:APC family permease [Candidatus Micrarchaeota archaeon]